MKFKINGPGKLIYALFILLFALMSASFVYAAAVANKPPLHFSKNQDVQQIKPKKPVKIKLHRNTKGEYQWDITGDNVDEIIRADKRLKKLLQIE